MAEGTYKVIYKVKKDMLKEYRFRFKELKELKKAVAKDIRELQKSVKAYRELAKAETKRESK